MKPCQHERLDYIGVQEIPGAKSLRLYNCRACHTTVARDLYYRTEEEIQNLSEFVEALRAYLLDMSKTSAQNVSFDTLEALINTVSRAKSILSNAEGAEGNKANKA